MAKNDCWTDLKVRTKILDLLDAEQVALTVSDIRVALSLSGERVRAAVAALVATGEVLACDDRRSKGRAVTRYRSDCVEEEAPILQEARR